MDECIKSEQTDILRRHAAQRHDDPVRSLCPPSGLGWPSNYSDRRLQWSWLNLMRRLLDNRVVHLAGRKQQYAKVRFGNRYLPQPAEAYQFWDHYTDREFSWEYLADVVVDADTRVRVRAAVAAIQWRHIVAVARRESSALPQDRYREVKHEEFVASPHRVLSSLITSAR